MMSNKEDFKEVDVFSKIGVHVVNTMIKKKGYMLGILAAAIEKIEYNSEGEIRVTLKDEVKEAHHKIMTDANKMAILVGDSE